MRQHFNAREPTSAKSPASASRTMREGNCEWPGPYNQGRRYRTPSSESLRVLETRTRACSERLFFV